MCHVLPWYYFTIRSQLPTATAVELWDDTRKAVEGGGEVIQSLPGWSALQKHTRVSQPLWTQPGGRWLITGKSPQCVNAKLQRSLEVLHKIINTFWSFVISQQNQFYFFQVHLFTLTIIRIKKVIDKYKITHIGWSKSLFFPKCTKLQKQVIRQKDFCLAKMWPLSVD